MSVQAEATISLHELEKVYLIDLLLLVCKKYVFIYIYIYIFTYIPSHTNIHVYNISHFPCIGGVRDGDGSVSVGRGSGASFAVCICISTRCSA